MSEKLAGVSLSGRELNPSLLPCPNYISVIAQNTIGNNDSLTEEVHDNRNDASEKAPINHSVEDHPITNQQISTKLSLNFLSLMREAGILGILRPKIMTVCGFNVGVRLGYFVRLCTKHVLQDPL